ncbi:prolyl 3-hydroxylase sudestada1 isoform X2 [Galleria mellonella]|uniref:Prolyl 3-hydroxylase sudestada1 isoform X2 n=1 Tax=Galleria mellonella TaxID=7137 RepID=A0ABM3MFG3_GALME|nr:prolyl 3-hydroxylase sudestada1 isoform X2 [Galleria mellonella]
MSSMTKENEEPSSSTEVATGMETSNGREEAQSEPLRPPAKRRLSGAVIEISDTDSDDSDVCAVNSYQASADEVKRIRGTEYSSPSSSSDYSSDSESPWEDDSILLNDEINKPAVRVQLNPRANRMDEPKFNPSLKSQDVIDKLTTHWQEMKAFKTDEVTLTCDPFRVCLVHELLANPDIINNIVDDMNTLDWSRKKMDLYEFYQTADLSSLTWQRSIRGIHELLKTEVMSWVSQVTGLELRSMSSSCSLYGPGDRLLVHDDLLADRRVAFILYLAPWRPPSPPPSVTDTSDDLVVDGAQDTPVVKNPSDVPNSSDTQTPSDVPVANGADDHVHEDVQDVQGGGWARRLGGALELLACDARGRPRRVARRVFPRNNMLAFFQVGPHSFHQVGEVLSLELPRLSINGWFHGPPPPGSELEPAPPEPEPEPEPERFHNDVVLLNEWVESTYMTPRNRAQIQAQMERESEVCLHDFLQPSKYEEVLQHLRSAPEEAWEAAGAAHERRHERAARGWLRALPAAHALRRLLALLSSAAFARLLADCTDLQLARHARLELQRWRAGDYALLPPRARYQQARLEAALYAGVPARPPAGGATTFVAPEEPDEPAADQPGAAAAAAAAAAASALVTLPPRSNALALVYCDAGAASFVSYLSKLAMRPHDTFYLLTCTYTE